MPHTNVVDAAAGTPAGDAFIGATAVAEGYQRQFHTRWAHLKDPHVRSLAWLLSSPDLLDSDAVQWHGQIATLEPTSPGWLDSWLRELDADPAPFHAALGVASHTRLGRYAEKLMALYFAARKVLRAYGVQVREGKGDTIGEFDFLLDTAVAPGVIHWEFATKFYLLHPASSGRCDDADYFVGPNLADTLGAKMRKILDRQLKLSRHPAARRLLSERYGIPADANGIPAKALVKGWLFYPQGDELRAAREAVLGVSKDHCRGFWCTRAEFAAQWKSAESLPRFALLPRLRWMAPVSADMAELIDLSTLLQRLEDAFASDHLPVLVAEMSEGRALGYGADEDVALEVRRGFVVPDDWEHRAGLRQR